MAFILFGVLLASWIYGLMSVVDFRKLPATVISVISSVSFVSWYFHIWAFLIAQSIKNLPADAGDAGSGRSPGGGNGSPLQYSFLENPIDGGAWQATVHGAAGVGHN